MLHIKLWLADEYYYRFCTNCESYDHDQKAKGNIIKIELGEIKNECIRNERCNVWLHKIRTYFI